MNRLLTGFVAAVIEAWQELRIHKLRVLLSLIGVTVAVAALTATVAFAQIGKQALVESYERDGRPALLTTYAYSDSGEGLPAPPAEARTAFEKVVDQFRVEFASARTQTSLRASTDSAAVDVSVQAVDPDYAAMHRVVVSSGRWLSDADAENRSPAVVAEPRFMRKLGLREAALPTTVTLQAPGGRPVSATVVGVASRDAQYSDQPGMFMLYDAYDTWFGAVSPPIDGTLEMWVPVDGVDRLAPAVAAAMRAELPGYQVDTSRSDYAAYGGGNELKPVALVVAGVSGLILLLGALSLLNVTVITIQQRVREIGVRRSFGATTGRVFFSIIMESVVATAVAGVIGVLIAVAAVNGPWTAEYLLRGIDDPPPFPASAALLGIGAALAVGAVAGVLPAIIAARVRIISAIRF